jgi:hypothetical protein
METPSTMENRLQKCLIKVGKSNNWNNMTGKNAPDMQNIYIYIVLFIP